MASVAHHSATQGAPIPLFPLPPARAKYEAAAYGALVLPVIMSVCWLSGIVHATKTGRLPDAFGLAAGASANWQRRLQRLSLVAFVVYPLVALIHCLRKFLNACAGQCWTSGTVARIYAGKGELGARLEVDVIGFWQPIAAVSLGIVAMALAAWLVYKIVAVARTT